MLKKLKYALVWLMIKWFNIKSIMGYISITDWCELEIIRKDGSREFKLIKGHHNTIATVGFALAAGLIGGIGALDPVVYLAVGTDNTAESDAHTALQAEITTGGLERANATETLVTTTETNDTLQLLHEWTASAAHVVEEVAALNAAAVGVMLGRKVTGTQTIGDADHLKITYKFKVS